MRPKITVAVAKVKPRNPVSAEDYGWTPHTDTAPAAFSRRFRVSFGTRNFTPGGEWSSGTVDTTVELAIVTDYKGEPQLLEELIEDDFYDLRHALNALKNPDVGIIAVEAEGSFIEDRGEPSDGAQVQVAHTFALRYRAAY